VKFPHWRGWLATAVIFILGVAVGVAGTAWTGARMLRRALQAPASAPGLANRAAERMGAELTKTLELTPAESKRVQAELDQTATNLKLLRVQWTEKAAAEIRGSTGRIAATLPPGKRAEFYRVIAKRYGRLGLATPELSKP